MKFHGITMTGKFTNQVLTSLPAWTTNDKGREIYLTDGSRWYGSETKWVKYGSGGSSFDLNQSGHGFSVLDTVYNNGTIWVKALADDLATVATHVVVDVEDVDNCTLAQSGKWTISGHGYSTGYYYTSNTIAGDITSTETYPIINKIIYVIDSDEIIVLPFLAYDITAFGGTGEGNVTEDMYSDLLKHSLYMNVTWDDYADVSFVDSGSTTMIHNSVSLQYDFTNGQILQSVDLFDSESDIVEITTAMISVDIDNDTSTFYMTADGIHWEEVTNNEIHSFTDTGTVLKLRVVGDGTGSIDSWAVLYKRDMSLLGDQNALVSKNFNLINGQTTVNIDYSINHIMVYMNGFLLDQSDYTADNGTSIILNSPADDGDILVVLTFGIFRTESQIPPLEEWGIVNTSPYTAVSNENLLIDTTSTDITVFLPSSPVNDDLVRFADLGSNYETNSLTVDRNGKTIMGLAENMIIDTNNIAFDLLYVSSTSDWRLV